MVPTIMSINLFKQYNTSEIDLLYATVAFGTVVSVVYSLLQFHVTRYTRSRVNLTILTATLLTLASITSIVGFHFIRINLHPIAYELPFTIRGQLPSSGSAIFRKHFYADFIPGLLIFSQTQLCSVVKHNLLTKAKRSFTFGEASLLAQLVSATYLTWALTTYSEITGAGPFQVNLTTSIALNVGFNTFSIIFVPSYLLLNRKSTLIRYALMGLSLALSYLRVQSLISASSNLDPLTWLIDHIFSTHQKISLFSIWLSTLTACVSFSTSWTRMVGRTNSLVRKVFHLALCFVFISGHNQDINFTRFAASCMLVLMLILEMIRAWQLEPLGIHLEKVCQSLRGKWDNKYLTLSHIYLLLGVFLPLWLLPDNRQTSKLSVSSGLIAVGVGDTAAAVVGTFFGKTKLRQKSDKSLEGLAGNFIAMLIFKLIWIGYLGFLSEFSFVIAALFTSLIESVTCTCDNLTLPLVMILLLELF